MNQPGGGSIASLMGPGGSRSPYLFWLRRRFWTDWCQLSCRCLGRLGSQGLVVIFPEFLVSRSPVPTCPQP